MKKPYRWSTLHLSMLRQRLIAQGFPMAQQNLSDNDTIMVTDRQGVYWFEAYTHRMVGYRLKAQGLARARALKQGAR